MKVKYSFASVLAEYERWVQNVSDSQEMITCKEQQVLMSEYQFETDKSPDAEQTLGDGGDLEEVGCGKFFSYKGRIKSTILVASEPIRIVQISEQTTFIQPNQFSKR